MLETLKKTRTKILKKRRNWEQIKAEHVKQNDGKWKKWKLKKKKNRQLLKWQLRTQEFWKSLEFFHFCFNMLSLFFLLFFVFLFFFKFLQVKSEFCSRSSLNAGKTETTRKQLFKNTKLEIASKMMMMENGNEQIMKKHENKMTIDLF